MTHPDAAPLPELRALLDLFSGPDASVALTVHAGGLLVCGRAVSRGTWLRALAGPDDPRTDPAAHALDDVGEAAAVRQFHRLAAENDIAAELSTAETRTAIRYMVDVALDAVGGDNVAEYAAWQIPISSVDGWTLGHYGPGRRIEVGPVWLSRHRPDGAPS